MDYKNIFTENGLINIEEFFYYMQNKFEYGWIDKAGNKHYGVNIYEYSDSIYASNITLVKQNPFIYNMSIRDKRSRNT